jgi:hypothetical protein
MDSKSVLFFFNNLDCAVLSVWHDPVFVSLLHRALNQGWLNFSAQQDTTPFLDQLSQTAEPALLETTINPIKKLLDSVDSYDEFITKLDNLFPGLDKAPLAAILRDATLSAELAERWDELWQEQHDIGFMVAGAMQADLIQDFHDAVIKARDGKLPFDAFRREFENIVSARGWTGWTGETTKKGRAWRANVIYETNLRQAYNAGRERQLADPDLLKRRPYGLYKHGDAIIPRDEHLAWDGKVVPLDDPWWDTHTPMNGFGCSCKKFALSEAEVKARGLKITRGADMPYQDEGIDPGFAYRPGGDEVRRMYRQMRDKAGRYPPGLRERFTGFLNRIYDSAAKRAREWEDARRVERIEKFVANPLGSIVVAELSDKIRQAIGAKTGKAQLSADTIKKNLTHHQDIGVDDYTKIAGLLKNPDMIVKDGQRSVVVIKTADKIYWLAIKSTETGKGVFITSFRQANEKDIRRLLKKGKRL